MSEARAVLRVTVLILVICAIGWRTLKPFLRSKATKQLIARHEQLRERLGPGLDPLFEQLIEDGHDQVSVVYEATRTTDTLAAYDGTQCAAGIDAAFDAVLGSDVLQVVQAPAGGVKLELRVQVAPIDRVYGFAGFADEYPAISMTGSAELVDLTASFEVTSPDELSINFFGSEISPVVWGGRAERPTPEQIQQGIVRAACEEVGYALLERWTTWRRPARPAPLDPVASCAHGVHCRAAGDSLIASDPRRASEMYARACSDAGDDEACSLVTVLAAPGDFSMRTRIDLGAACQLRPAPCLAAGRMAMIPEYGDKVSPHMRREALAWLLRACDRGIAEGCEEARPLLRGTLFAEAAALPGTRRTISSRRFGTIFAVRWGQWTLLDRGQATAWVTRLPSSLPAGATSREFAVAELPRGIVPPPGVATVHAIALDGYGSACVACSPDYPAGTIGGPSCVCALDPANH